VWKLLKAQSKFGSNFIMKTSSSSFSYHTVQVAHPACSRFWYFIHSQDGLCAKSRTIKGLWPIAIKSFHFHCSAIGLHVCLLSNSRFPIRLLISCVSALSVSKQCPGPDPDTEWTLCKCRRMTQAVSQHGRTLPASIVAGRQLFQTFRQTDRRLSRDARRLLS